MKVMNVLAWSYLVFCITPLITAHAQFSIIDRAQRLNKSVVEILATTEDGYKHGAGVLVTHDGLIATNFHTVHKAKHLQVKSRTGDFWRPKIIAILPAEDLCLLKIPQQQELKPMLMADSNQLKQRQAVIHVGNSFLRHQTLSEGQITGLGQSRQLRSAGIDNIALIRINIHLYKGDSGGPLLNKNGQLIGMIVAKDTTEDGVSYAIPANKIKKLLSSYIK